MKRERSKELSTKEVAARFDVETRSVRNWCQRGLLLGAYEMETPRGPVWMIPESALCNFVQPKQGPVPKSKPASPAGRTEKRAA